MKNFKKDFICTLKFSVNSKRGGFTLIELLVIVAIIGILASVIFVALSDSQKRGADAAVKANLNTIRSMSELFASNNGNLFLPSGGSTFSIATCPAYNGAGTNMLSKEKTLASAIVEAVKRGGNGSSCYNSSFVWAVAVGLKSSASTFWCVDSGGASRQVNSAPSGAINSSTFLCN